jgi:hypothetical protein
MKILLGDFNAKISKEDIFKPTIGNESLHEISNDNGVRGPPLWTSGQSFWLQIQRSRVRFLALPDFLRSRGSGTGSTQDN